MDNHDNRKYMRYIPKLVRMGGRNTPSIGITLPKELITKYGLGKEDYVLLEEDEDKEVLIIKKINYA